MPSIESEGESPLHFRWGFRPRTPEDCPACCRGSRPASQRVPQRQVRPWGEVKNRRGKRKQINTAGYAWVNQSCDYYGITDASVHALVGMAGTGRENGSGN